MQTARVHIQSTAVSIIARIAARVGPNARLRLADLALKQLLVLVGPFGADNRLGPAPATVQRVADLAIGNLAKDTPQVSDIVYSTRSGKADKSATKKLWSYLVTAQPYTAHLCLLGLKAMLLVDPTEMQRIGNKDVGKSVSLRMERMLMHLLNEC